MTTKTELVSRLSIATGISKDKVREVLDALADITFENLAVNDIAVLPGLGKLKMRQRGERIGRNPKTGDSMTIPARGVVRFSASRGLKAFAIQHFPEENLDIVAGD